jgi:hypothetical protein
MLGWFRRQREAAWLAQADAETLMFTKGGNAYAEARRRERISLLRVCSAHEPRMRAHWRRVADLIAKQAWDKWRVPQT